MSQQVKASQAAKEEGENQKQFLGSMEECGERAQYHNLVDILFVIDATGSMSWCISQLKKTVCKIMKKFSDKQYNIKFAIELYRDHPPQEYSYIEKHFDLRNQDAIIKVIDDQCDVAGGGDTPEAVFDGLVHGLKKTSWRVSTDGKTKSKRFLFHGCDAPPHGKQYGSTSSDKNWNEKGCPCGFTRQDVKKLLFQHNVDYSLIKCGSQADIMSTLFKQCFAEKFKRQLQIKQQHNVYKRGKAGKGLQRKLSVQYMEQIEREQASGSQQQGSYSSQVNSGCAQDQIQNRICVDELDELNKKSVLKQVEQKKSEKKSILSSIKEALGFKSQVQQKLSKPQASSSIVRQGMVMPIQGLKKEKKKKKKKVVKARKQQKKQQKYQNSSDDQKGGRPRSMASLVLSDIQDGIDNYFQQPKKQQKKPEKQTKQI